MDRGRRLIAALGLVIVAGCSAGAPTVAPDAQPVCDAITSVDMSVAALKGLDPVNSTVDQVRAAADTVSLAVQNLRTVIGTQAQAGMAQLTGAIDNLQASATSIPPGTTPSEAISGLQDELDAVTSADGAVRSELGCPAA